MYQNPKVYYGDTLRFHDVTTTLVTTRNRVPINSEQACSRSSSRVYWPTFNVQNIALIPGPGYSLLTFGGFHK